MPASSQTSPTSSIRVHRLAAGLAADRHGVDPRTAELLELIEPRDGALLELGAGADHVQVPAGAGVERQRQPVVAAARDVPVAHVPEPVVHALAHVLGRPLDGRVRVEERLTHLVDADEPVVREPEDERRVAAPALRVAVLVLLRLDEQARDRRGRRRSALRRLRSRGRAASRRRDRSDRPRRPGRSRRGRAPSRARSPRRRSPGRCGRSRFRPPSRRRPTGSRGARPRRRARARRTGPRSASRRARRPRARSTNVSSGKRAHRDPVAVLEAAVLRTRVDGGGDVGGQRPGRRRPDHDRPRPADRAA